MEIKRIYYIIAVCKMNKNAIKAIVLRRRDTVYVRVGQITSYD